MEWLTGARAPVVATPRVMSLVTGFLYVVGGIAVLPTGVAGLPGNTAPGLLTIGAVAVVTGTWIMRWGSWLPRGAYHVLVSAGTGLIVLAAYLAPDAVTATALAGVITFVALDTFFYFAWPGALVQLTLAITSSAWVLHRRPEVTPSAWIALALICVGIAVVVGALVRRASSASVDPVTELANRRGFDEALEDLLRTATRTGEPLAAALLDIDHFKAVNDTHGHAAGDQLLRSLAVHWRPLLPAGAVLARHGGDEFSLILPGHAGEQAFAVVERLRQAAETGLSCGVTGHLPGDTASQLMRRADRALYQAKAAGRGRSVMDEQQAVDALVADLTGALDEAEDRLDRPAAAGAIQVEYQPIVAVPDSSVIGVEALVRWTRPGVGLVPPGRFIPVAEESGLIGRLGDLVLHRACVDLVALREQTGQQLMLTVNVSGLQLCDPAFPARVRSTLDQTGWPAASTVLEVTESLVDADSPAALAGLSVLREHGISVAIDDFGTGYSALSRLDTLHCDYLKLDHSFIATLTTSTRRARLLKSLLTLAEALDLVVIAEGVETPAQADSLRELGCALAQGHHFLSPAPLAALVEALRGHRAA